MKRFLSGGRRPAALPPKQRYRGKNEILLDDEGLRGVGSTVRELDLPSALASASSLSLKALSKFFSLIGAVGSSDEFVVGRRPDISFRVSTLCFAVRDNGPSLCLSHVGHLCCGYVVTHFLWAFEAFLVVLSIYA
ncbi:hypothetical protein V6N11_051612 [Hibiscus sabdariffa]|uniref:Uncharacterized protein n=1 Tax=Hibiscus sabdariffa TaxID=183260 RepID=A0ABR2U7K6_9ROSI